MPKPTGQKRSRRGQARRTPTRPRKAAQRRTEVEPPQFQESTPVQADQKVPSIQKARQNLMVTALMALMLVLFVLIAIVAPDPTAPNHRPHSSTIIWRMIFLLIPLGAMYALLWWDRVSALFKRRGVSRP